MIGQAEFRFYRVHPVVVDRHVGLGHRDDASMSQFTLLFELALTVEAPKKRNCGLRTCDDESNDDQHRKPARLLLLSGLEAARSMSSPSLRSLVPGSALVAEWGHVRGCERVLLVRAEHVVPFRSDLRPRRGGVLWLVCLD